METSLIALKAEVVEKLGKKGEWWHPGKRLRIHFSENTVLDA